MTAIAPTSPRRRAGHWVILGLWIVLTIALIVGASRIPWRQAMLEMASARLGWIVIAVLANFAILPLWAMEWRLLVPGSLRVPAGRMFGIVAVTASVLNSVPFLAGEASAVALLITRGGLSRGAALSVLAMDQVFVAFAKLAVFAVALALASIPPWVRAGGTGLVFVLAAALAVLVPVAHHWSRLRDWLLSRPTRLRGRMATLVTWGEHLELLREPRRLMPIALLALAKKTLELAAIVTIQLAFGLQPSISTAVLVLAALALATLIPVSPANLGVYEGTVFAIYRLTGTSPELSLSLALVQHLAFLLPSVLTGYVVLSARPLRRTTT